jgi:hypothetical protein
MGRVTTLRPLRWRKSSGELERRVKSPASKAAAKGAGEVRRRFSKRAQAGALTGRSKRWARFT